MGKIVYNVIINTGGAYITYHKVNSIAKFKLFADRKFPGWKFATVYDGKTKIEVIKP